MTRPTPRLVLSAYMQGVFPMAHPDEGDHIYWYAPDPRAILPLDGLQVSRRLSQTLRTSPFEIAINRDFEQVISACAAPRSEDGQTWISNELAGLFVELHHLGFAHSVEAWQEDRLVGGLYGVALGGLFAGESMFHRVRDASKVCLVHLVQRLNTRGFALLDIQFLTDHLARFGALEIPREEYERRLAQALPLPCSFVDA
jgi:leucyl/phenylalanyl-tRNA---protein transferase